MAKWIDEHGVIHEYNPAPETEPQLTQVFKTPKKTLKLELVNENVKLADAVYTAYATVSKPDCEYNRIEFKYGRCYIVVAKLKD